MTIFGSNNAIKTLGTLHPTYKETYNILSRRFEGGIPPKGVGQVFRVMQWNVLAQGLTGSGPRKNFCKTPPRYLEWETRRYLLLLEVLSYMPDVLILQEVDRYEWLEPKLREFGYKGKFKERPFSPCVDMPDDDSAKPDGCAIFYHSDRFDIKDVVHRQLVNQMEHGTSCVALGLKLQFLEDNAEIFVVGSHLKGGPKTDQARFESCIDLCNFISEHAGAGSMVVVGADICENPDEQGYEHLTSKFKDSYRFALSGRHPPWTTWRWRPIGEEKYTNDVILYNEQALRVLQVLDVPGHVGEIRLPSNACGSDHIPLVTDFQRIVQES